MLRYNSLKKWKSKNLLSGTATYRVLLQALLDCGCNDQAKQACPLLKESLLYQHECSSWRLLMPLGQKVLVLQFALYNVMLRNKCTMDKLNSIHSSTVTEEEQK